MILALICVPLFGVSVFLTTNQGYDFLTSLRYGSYAFISSITTSGFANFPSIPFLGPATLTLIIIMTIIGGGMGSTSGGVKQYRFIIAFKSFYWSLKEKGSSKRKIYPHNIIRLGEDKEVTNEEVSEAYN